MTCYLSHTELYCVHNKKPHKTEDFRMNKTEERMLKKIKELKELEKQIAEL